MTSKPASARGAFVRAFWASHNDSPAFRNRIRALLADLDEGCALNVGCGRTRLDPRICNVDLSKDSTADVRGDSLALPFAEGCFDLVLSQETVEHVADPFRAVREMARVLRPGGRLYLQAPFIIGYHPGPDDYWRFTRSGIRRLVEQAGLQCEAVEVAVGAGTGAYRIAVEFIAGGLARILPALYIPAKALASLLFFPLTGCNAWHAGGRERDRIPGGYFAVGIKPC